MPTPMAFEVSLVVDSGTGVQTVNFAIPLAPGTLTDADAIAIRANGEELAAAKRALARHGDDSIRSLQVQLSVDAATHPKLAVSIGEVGIPGPALVPVASTLTGTGSNVRPRVWAVLPTSVLVASGVAGPVIAHADFAGTPLDAWSSVCDYDQWDTDAFLVNAGSSRDVWLYDRVTAMVRGYVATGELSPLRSAYREAAMYRDGMTIGGNGLVTGVAPPTANGDLKYYYAQGMALHYLLTGDDRFREAAEAMSATVATMWNPNYDGGDRFWTERHAGFALLAHEWALRVTDDKAAAITTRADAAVNAYLTEQMTFPPNYNDQEARCFAHSASAHGEDFGTYGCSPWMSAILADALDAHARRVGGQRALDVNASLGRLGRSLARDGRDGSGKPYYWMGIGTQADEVDPYDEHWGEAAYVVALAWHATGRSDAALRTAADQLVAGMRDQGEAGQVRSFNWQCRSAIMTPGFLK